MKSTGLWGQDKKKKKRKLNTVHFTLHLALVMQAARGLLCFGCSNFDSLFPLMSDTVCAYHRQEALNDKNVALLLLLLLLPSSSSFAPY